MSYLKDIDPLGVHNCMIQGKRSFIIESNILLDLYQGHNILDAYDQGGYGSFDKQYAFDNCGQGYCFQSLTYFGVPFAVSL